MGHLNSFSASGERNLNKNFPKIQMPAGLPREGGGMFKLRFDWYIRRKSLISRASHPQEFVWPIFSRCTFSFASRKTD